jgi:hypothetical protein
MENLIPPHNSQEQQVPQQQPALQQEHLPIHSFPKRQTGKFGLIFSMAVVLLILGGVSFGYWHYKQNGTSSGTLAGNNNSGVVTGDLNGNQLEPGNTGYPTTTPPQEPPLPSAVVDLYSGAQCNNRGSSLSSKSGLVEWIDPKVQNIQLFASSTLNSGYSDYLGDMSYVVGHITGGSYSGGDLLITVASFDEPGGEYWYHIVHKGNQYYFLNKYSDSFPDLSTGVRTLVSISQDKNFDLPDLDLQQKIHLGNPAAEFTLASTSAFLKNGTQFFCADSYNKVYTDSSVGDVYTDSIISTKDESGNIFSSPNGFYVKSPDGTLVTYTLDIPIQGTGNMPLVIWSNGKKNDQEYAYQTVGGCGSSNFLDAVDVDVKNLVQAGTDIAGQAVFGFKDSNAPELKMKYDTIYVPDGEKKISYSSFVASHPIFFWKDALGNFVRFTTKKYQPLAECGKPVIYLYPEQTEKVSVQLTPVGGFSHTEPSYNNGWNVIADPLGTITNLADGKTYPYLFWEGRGGMYQTPDKGFVVKQSDVHELLENKLSLAGLNEKERKDFEEFWEPKMQSSPYYFVTFMGNNVMDQIAPLSISPKPDTVIRILMDFTPLDHPITVQGFTIHAPVRKGFTVVEWGGVLR